MIWFKLIIWGIGVATTTDDIRKRLSLRKLATDMNRHLEVVVMVALSGNFLQRFQLV